MVRHPCLVGVDVSIVSCGQRLPEFEKFETGDEDPRTAVRWIESQTGVYFGVLFRYDGLFECGNLGMQESIRLDGELVHLTKVCSETLRAGRIITHSRGNVRGGPRGLFQFFPLALGDHLDENLEADTQDLYAELGTIRVELHRIKEIAPRDRTRNWHSSGPAQDTSNQTIDEKVLKGRNLSHRARLDPNALPGSRRNESSARPTFKPLDPSSRPCASFVYRYASQKILRLMGVLPPSNEELAFRFEKQHQVQSDLKRFAKQEDRDDIKDFLDVEEDEMLVVGERRIDNHSRRTRTKKQIQKLQKAPDQIRPSTANPDNDIEVQFLGAIPRDHAGIRETIQLDNHHNSARTVILPKDRKLITETLNMTKKRPRSSLYNDSRKRRKNFEFHKRSMRGSDCNADDLDHISIDSSSDMTERTASDSGIPFGINKDHDEDIIVLDKRNDDDDNGQSGDNPRPTNGLGKDNQSVVVNEGIGNWSNEKAMSIVFGQ